MLTSAKRRILNIICVALAICSVAYGLVLKYNNAALEPNIDFSVQQDSFDPNIVEVVNTQDQFKDEDLISNPD